MHRKSDFDKSERVDVYFLAKKWDGNITNKEPNKCSELKWFEVNKLPPNMVGAVRRAVIDIIGGAPYSEYGLHQDNFKAELD